MQDRKCSFCSPPHIGVACAAVDCHKNCCPDHGRIVFFEPDIHLPICQDCQVNVLKTFAGYKFVELR